MLKLTGITKEYLTGDSKVLALKGIDIEFRKNEFVAILGHSGCGKTTLLNIIGGLDQYTSGDLCIDGRSTKEYKPADWDAYRNHSIGFVFQSYNLIPHQTVLANVELALTLSGVSRAERKRRAIEVLQKVGLGDQLYKKPNQMSGGQMQRVAIARALINDPEILLADEPTGALDSETSVQIMDILKEISHDRLIIMVTHNPELAEAYATRIVRLVDGRITGDSDPYLPEPAVTPAVPAKQKRQKHQGKTSMSFFTALSLSLNNLMTKKTRTLLTAFAGSIGIIGIALILSLSNGIQSYIDQVQEDTLSSYPITIQAETVDMSGLLTAFMDEGGDNSGEGGHDKDAVYSSTVMYDLLNSLNSVETNKNNLKAFKEYLDDPESPVHDYASAIQYSYNLNFDIYTKDADGKIVKSDVMDMMEDMMSGMYGGDYSSYFSSSYMQNFSNLTVWQEMLSGTDGEIISPVLTGQYDLLYGSWPQNYDEVVLIVNSNNEISDLVLYALGLKTNEDMQEVLQAYIDQTPIEDVEAESWSYEDVCNMTFKLLLPSEYYRLDSTTGTYTDLSATDAGLSFLYDSDTAGVKLKIVGIIRPNEDAVSTMMSGAIGYTSELTSYCTDRLENTDIINDQLSDPETDVFSGLPFPTDDDTEPSDDEKAVAIKEYITTLDESSKADIYTSLMSTPTDEYLESVVNQQMDGLTREAIEQSVIETYSQEMGVDADTVSGYIAGMDDETLFSYVRESISQQVSEQYAQQVQAQLAQMTTEQLSMALDAAIAGDTVTSDQYAEIYDNYMPATVSDSTYDDNLTKLGYVREDSPSAINIYAATFENKDSISDLISAYNDSASEEDQISYTDYVALLMSSITTIINAISYVLIAFVAISLVVSSIMIGIITYISVLERTKEIGILRSIGASRRDVSRVFNAETLIEGFVAGLLGVGLTLLLTIPINVIVHKLTNIMALNAKLPAAAGFILVAISMGLTLIAGIIPSRVAARKDPVEALRTE